MSNDNKPPVGAKVHDATVKATNATPEQVKQHHEDLKKLKEQDSGPRNSDPI